MTFINDMHATRSMSRQQCVKASTIGAFTTVQGTQHGEFMGMPATGHSFTITNADYCRFTDDGRIAEHWGLVDMASMMRQLGAAG